MRSRTLVSKTSTAKLNKTNTQSSVLSIHVEVKDGRRIKLLFDENLTLEQWVGATNGFMDMVIEHYDGIEDNQLDIVLSKLELNSDLEIYAVIDHEKSSWLFYDTPRFVEMIKAKHLND